MRPCGRCRRWSIPARRRVVAGRRSTARTGSTWPRRAAQTRGWQTGLFSLYGRLVVKKYKTFLATYKPVGGVIRVVLVREPDRWVAYFSTDPDLSVASILETVADRSALEQVFHDVKEVHGAGQQQLRHVWANVGAWNLIGWWHTLVELWAWDRPQSRLRDRSDSPWDKPERRPSHANRCQELRREALQEEYSSLPSVGGLRQKSAGSFSASCAESHEADSSGKVQQQGKLTENTIIRGEKTKRPEERKNKQKKYARRSSHCFVMGLLITPSGMRLPFSVSYYTEAYCKAKKIAYHKQTELAAQLIRQLPLPPEARVVVLGDTAFDAKAIRTACEERKFSWIVPINPERVLAGEKPRPKVSSLSEDLTADQMVCLKVHPGKGKYVDYRRISRYRIGPKFKPRTYYVHEESRDVHSVGKVRLGSDPFHSAHAAIPVVVVSACLSR